LPPRPWFTSSRLGGGKPTGNSPSELTHSDKAELEIVPNPLPREHWRYASNQEAEFIVRFRGQPLANFPVAISTSNGSNLEFKTDAGGQLRIRVPDDFKVVNVGRRNNPPAEWRIKVEHENGGFQFRTVLSANYHADPNHWQPLSWGLVAMAAGMPEGNPVDFFIDDYGVMDVNRGVPDENWEFPIMQPGDIQQVIDDYGSYDEVCESLGLTPEGIVAKTKELIA